VYHFLSSALHRIPAVTHSPPRSAHWSKRSSSPLMLVHSLTMPSSSSILFLSSAVFALTNALPWAGPVPTVSYNPVDISPRTTSLPAVRSVIGKRTIVPSNTCGWVGGDINQPDVCAGQSSCVWDTARAIVGCCPITGPCTNGIFTGCVDSNNAAPTAVNPNIHTWYGPRGKEF
jgi:hypothetical protein